MARDRLRGHPVAAFFVLAYLVAWAGVPFRAAGLLPEPLFLPCGPLVAAVVVVGLTEGRAGFRVLGARLVRWRVGWVWWAVAVALPVALLNTAAGAAAPRWPPWGGVALLVGLYLVNPLGGALGEEPGWRGYAQPGLQAGRPRLAATLVLGVLVAGWHLPLVLYGWLPPIGLVSTVAITVVYAWLFNHTGGSALITLVSHAVQDAFTYGALGYGPADTPRVEYLYCAVVVAVAVALIGLDRAAWRADPASADG
jgi:uncharacterized protein